MEKKMEKNMEHDMETVVIEGHMFGPYITTIKANRDCHHSSRVNIRYKP